MNLLALIPARGGSKGIPRKNIRLLNGKPLIVWTLEAAQRSHSVSRIVVSTEDLEIAAIARDCGADVPFMRPAELARDDTPGIQPVLHAIDQLPDYDWVLLLQPTSPLRTAEDIDGIVSYCHDHGAPAAVSISDIDKHPCWMYYRDDHNLLIPFVASGSASRRQDLPPLFALNGSLYLAKCSWLRQYHSFLGPGTIGYQIPVERSADIDTLTDWKWVEYLLNDCLSP